jgi:ribosomal protein S18 acetylase RimI-like enzyme
VSSRMQGIGRKLVEAVELAAKQRGQAMVRLKCPEDLPANRFYRSLGFAREALEPGKRRRLVVWGRHL